MRFSRIGLYLQTHSYLNTYLTQTSKLETKVKLMYRPFIAYSDMQMIFLILIYIFMSINENVNLKAIVEKIIKKH